MSVLTLYDCNGTCCRVNTLYFNHKCVFLFTEYLVYWVAREMLLDPNKLAAVLSNVCAVIQHFCFVIAYLTVLVGSSLAVFPHWGCFSIASTLAW